MPSNKRVRSSKSKSGIGILDDTRFDPGTALRMQERALKKRMHRMRVEMVANRLGFPIGRDTKLSLAQAAQKRRRTLVQIAEFLVTAILIAGAAAWLYQWWLTRQ